MTDLNHLESASPIRVRSERSANVFQAFVERKRMELKENYSALRELERKALEGWFSCLALSGEIGLETDLDEARAELHLAEANLEDANAAIARAELRLRKYERHLLSLTTGPRDL